MKEKELNLSLVDITIGVEDFAVDDDGTIRIASKKLAKRIKTAIDEAKATRPNARVQGKMVIPIET